MQLLLCTSMGYYICGIHPHGMIFSNQMKLAKNFIHYSVQEFQKAKKIIEHQLKSELEVIYNIG